MPVLLYLYLFSGWVHGFSGQIREVESDDVVETPVSMYGVCTVSCIFSPEAQSKCLSFYTSGKGAVCVIRKGRKYLTPSVVKLAPAYNETPSVALCNSQNTLSSCFLAVFYICLSQRAEALKKRYRCF